MTEQIFNAPTVAAAASLRQIPDNENFKRRDEVVDSNSIRVTFAVRVDQDSPRFEKTITFDYTGCTREQLMLLSATNGVVVWAQRVLREMGSGLTDPKNLSTVHVLDDIISGPARVQVDPAVRAKRLLARLSPEEREAILAEYSEGVASE